MVAKNSYSLHKATDGTDALEMARKAGAAIQALGIPHKLSTYGFVTVSIGVAALVPAKGESPELLVKLADEALYRAKELGRNRVELAVKNLAGSACRVSDPV